MSAFYIAFGFIDSAICFAIGTVILVRLRRQAWDLMLLLYGLTVWMAIPCLAYIPSVPLRTHLVNSMMDIVVFIPAIMLLFGLRTMQKPLWHPVMIGAVVVSLFFLATHRSVLYSAGARVTPTGLVPIPGPLYVAFQIYFALISFYGIFAAFWAYRNAVGWQKSRLLWLCLAYLSGLVGKVVHTHTVLAFSGQEPIWNHLFINAFALVSGYALFTRRLYDVELLSRDAAIRLGTIVVVALPLILGVLMHFWTPVQMAVGLGLILVAPRLLPKIRALVQRVVDQHLYREKYFYLEEIQRVADDIFRFTNIPDLLKHLVNDLSSRAHLVWVGVWLYDLSGGLFVLRQASDTKSKMSLQPAPDANAPLRSDDVALQWMEQQHRLVIAADLATPGENPLPGTPFALELNAARQLHRLHLGAAFPIYIGKKLIGFIGFGPKEDATMFHQADYASLTELGSKAEHAIGQAYMLYEQSLMLSKLAHDTLNALHSLGMVLNIIHDGMIGPINEVQKKHLGTALIQRQFIEDCLTDLRELERLVMLRMQGTWRMDTYDLTQAAQEAVKAYQPRALSKGVVLEGQWSSVSPAIGDQRAVRRVIDNLIVNALKFTPSGGRIDVSILSRGDNLSVVVTDTGTGIPPQELPRIFDPFYQGPSGLSVAKGTGLGLSVVKEVAALHKGSVHVESTVGLGTTFTVELPSLSRQKEFVPTAAAA